MHSKYTDANIILIIYTDLKLTIKIALTKSDKCKTIWPDLVCDLLMVSGLILGADGKLPYCSCNLCS